VDALVINLAAPPEEKGAKAAAGPLNIELERRGNFEAISQPAATALLQVQGASY
jgi:hypothetical protein